MRAHGSHRIPRFRKTGVATLLAGASLWAGNGHAFVIASDNPDVQMRFDNTIRYNAAWRVAHRNPGIGNNPAFDESEYLFGNGDMITNRIDLFSEFDFTYRDMGFRVSGAAWYDDRYGINDKSNPLLPAPNYIGNRFSDYVQRYYAGPSGEFLDAFVWKNFSLGGTDLAVKAGRHAVLWGEATFPVASANSVAADMAPSDQQKQVLSPGATAKETTLPINQLTGTWQLTSAVSLSGQYTFEWRPTRVPEGGTYFGFADAVLFGPDLANGGPANGALTGPRVPLAQPIEGDRGDIGLSLRWTPEWLDYGSLGFYYRKFDAKFPTWPADTFLAPGPQARAVYAKDISLWGISYGATIASTAVGMEISHRHNTPLNMNAAAITNAALGFEGPRGDTWHALINTTTPFNKTDYWTSAALVLELTYQELDKVTSNPGMYKSRAYTLLPGNSAGVRAACTVDDIVKGCSTDSAWHFALLFQPVWAQVFPSMDFTGTFVLQTGLKGNAPTTGIAEGATTLNLGLQIDYAVVNRFNISYTNFYGKRKYLGATSAAGPFQSANGAGAIYDDRDFVSFTYSRTF